MVGATLAQVVERKPDLARDAFYNLEGALNLLLPGSSLHERYRDVAEIALAGVIARDAHLPIYSPLDPDTPSRVSCLITNRGLHPSAWEPKDTDAETLGGPVPPELGRFAAFVLAKINWLTQTMEPNSFDPKRISIEPGMVGIAGGLHIASSLAGTSGLWEVHDHVATHIWVREILSANRNGSSANNADQLAGYIEPIFERVRLAHGKTPADKLERRRYDILLAHVYEAMFNYRRQT